MTVSVTILLQPLYSTTSSKQLKKIKIIKTHNFTDDAEKILIFVTFQFGSRFFFFFSPLTHCTEESEGGGSVRGECPAIHFFFFLEEWLVL